MVLLDVLTSAQYILIPHIYDMARNSERTILSFHDDNDHYESKSSDTLLRESRHIQSSEILIDEQLDIAMRTRETLKNQRHAIKAMQTQFTNITNKFPIINSLVQRIHIRKRRDTIILAIVFCLCAATLFYYLIK